MLLGGVEDVEVDWEKQRFVRANKKGGSEGPLRSAWAPISSRCGSKVRCYGLGRYEE